MVANLNHLFNIFMLSLISSLLTRRDFVTPIFLQIFFFSFCRLVFYSIIDIFICYVYNSREPGDGQFRGSSSSVMTKVLDYKIMVCNLKILLHYHIHFCSNTLGKKYKPPYSSCYSLNNTTAFL